MSLRCLLQVCFSPQFLQPNAPSLGPSNEHLLLIEELTASIIIWALSYLTCRQEQSC